MAAGQVILGVIGALAVSLAVEGKQKEPEQELALTRLRLMEEEIVSELLLQKK